MKKSLASERRLSLEETIKSLDTSIGKTETDINNTEHTVREKQ